MSDKDKEEFNKWWNNYAHGDFDDLAFNSWEAACEYKQKENTDLVMKLQTRIESLIAENAKLFEEAKRELAYKDKKIAYLEAECERVYHPIREFWNQEKDEEMKRLQNKLDEATSIIQEIVDSDDDRYNRPRYYSKCKEFLV